MACKKNGNIGSRSVYEWTSEDHDEASLEMSR